MLTVRKWLPWLAHLLIVCSLLRASSDQLGYLLIGQHWNNYGLQLNIYQNDLLISSANTSLTGSFYWPELSPGVYQVQALWHGKSLGQREIFLPTKDFLWRLPAQPDAFFITLISLILNLLFLGVGINLWRGSKKKVLAKYFLFMLSAPLFFVIIEFWQIVLAHFYLETIAGVLMPLKIVGLITFGPAFYRFYQLIARQEIRDNKVTVFHKALLILETVILLSWIYFANDEPFQAFWHFSFSGFRNFLALQLCVYVLFGIKCLFQNNCQERSLWLSRQIKGLILSSSITIAIIFFAMFLPLILFNKELIPFSLAISLAITWLFISFLYLLIDWSLPASDYVISHSLVYSVITVFFVMLYGLFWSYLEQSLKNTSYASHYILGLLFVIGVLLSGTMARLLRQLVFRKTYIQRASLHKLGQEILAIIDSKVIVKYVQKELKAILNADQIILKLGKPKNSEQARVLGIKYRDQYLGYLEIITQQKFNPLLEEQWHLFLAELAIALHNARQHGQLLNSVQKIETANRLSAVGTLAAGVAHEIKNPLGIIYTLVTLLPQKIQEKDFLDKFTEIVPRQIRRMDELVRSLLNFSRQGSFSLELIDVQEPLLNACRLFKSGAKGIVLETRFIKAEVQGDKQSLERCFLNLLLNAQEAMPEGGKLIIHISRAGNYAKILFKDSGCGIARKELSQIFQPFFSTKRSGTGLGLYSVQNTLQGHKGSIQVKSKVGIGTEFIVKLPLVRS